MNTRSHPKKLTVQLINDRLSERGLEIIGRYINAHTKSEFRCQYQHEWLALPMNVLAGKGCPHCANRAKLTPEFINDRLREREITMIGKYYNTHTLTLFNCIHKHEWLATPTNVLRGSGCPECAGNKLSTEEFVKTKLPSSISMIGQYINARTKIKFRHDCGKEWESTPDNIIRGKGCPSCAEYGFNPRKPGHIYLLEFERFSKVGITNDLDRRLREHERHNGLHSMVVTRLFEDGQTALDLERHIKTMIKNEPKASREECPDGFTETLPLELTESVKALIVKGL
jgi:predicted GIY-YIG superfamily endonuclease